MSESKPDTARSVVALVSLFCGCTLIGVRFGVLVGLGLWLIMFAVLITLEPRR